MPNTQKYLLGVGIMICILLLTTSAIFLLEAIRRGSAVSALAPAPTLPTIVQGPSAKSGVLTQELSLEKTMGEVGEVKIKDKNSGEEKQIITPSLPAIITSTVGRIISKQGNTLAIEGLGSNFADGASRELKAIVTDNTLVLAEGGTKQYQGQAGLVVLTDGRKVLVEGEGNIRGKTEFNIKTINIIN